MQPATPLCRSTCQHLGKGSDGWQFNLIAVRALVGHIQAPIPPPLLRRIGRGGRTRAPLQLRRGRARLARVVGPAAAAAAAGPAEADCARAAARTVPDVCYAAPVADAAATALGVAAAGREQGRCHDAGDNIICINKHVFGGLLCLLQHSTAQRSITQHSRTAGSQPPPPSSHIMLGIRRAGRNYATTQE